MQFIEKRGDIDCSTLHGFDDSTQSIITSRYCLCKFLKRNQPLTQNFIFYLLIYLHRKYIPFQLKLETS